jgi:hypothetical protein
VYATERWTGDEHLLAQSRNISTRLDDSFSAVVVLIEFIAEGLEHGENMSRRLVDWCCGRFWRLCFLGVHHIAFPRSLVACHGVVLLGRGVFEGDGRNVAG